MKKTLLLYFFLFLVLNVEAQISSLLFSSRRCIEFGNLSKEATLYVVIENEKNADDAALIAAVKDYWKIGKIKYLSGLEFSEKIKSLNFEKNNLYLFNNFLRNYTGYNVFEPGFILTNDPSDFYTNYGVSSTNMFLFFPKESVYDKKGFPIKGFYSLMIKNFNHEIKYCQNEKNFEKKRKNKRKRGIYFFKQDSLFDKTILLVKEQTNKEDKKTREKNERRAKKSKNFKDNEALKVKSKMVVFPEDIEYAVKTNDKNIVLYSGGNLYLASDGSICATVNGKTSDVNKVNRFFTYAAGLVTVLWLISTLNL